MMTMHETMSTVHRALRDRSSVANSAAELAVPLARLHAYQSFVESHIHAALYKNYTTLADLLQLPQGCETGGAPDRWDAICAAYFSQCPADDYEVNHCVRDFPQWLSAQRSLDNFSLTDFHVELAAFEQREFAVYASIAPSPIVGARHPVLNPTLEVLQFDYPVGSFVSAFRDWQSGSGPLPSPPRLPAPETVFVFRHPETLRHRFAVADARLLLAFKIAHDRIDVTAAAAAANASTSVVAAAIAYAARLGIIEVAAATSPTQIPSSRSNLGRRIVDSSPTRRSQWSSAGRPERWSSRRPR